MPYTKPTFHARFAEARKAAGYPSARQFALAHGYHPRAVTAWESGQSRPKCVADLARVSRILRVSLDWLVPDSYQQSQLPEDQKKRAS